MGSGQLSKTNDKLRRPLTPAIEQVSCGLVMVQIKEMFYVHSYICTVYA